MSLKRTLSDPRLIYLTMFITLAAPALYPIGLPLAVSGDIRKIYDALEKLPPKGAVVISMDMAFESWGECGPQATTFFRYLLKKDVKIIFVAFQSQAAGAMFAESMIAQVPIPKDKQYGVDYVNLGFIPGTEGAIRAFAEDIHKAVGRDYRGTPIENLPIMNNVKSARDISFWIDVSGAGFPEMYIRQLQVPYGMKIVAACQASEAATVKPFLASGQLTGLMNSLRGAAEFELLTGTLGVAASQMDAQSLIHMILLIAVIIGNILYIRTRLGGVK
jgi:hypothetical protein